MIGRITVPSFKDDVVPFGLALLLYVFSLGITSSHMILVSMVLIIFFSPHHQLRITKELKIVLFIIALSLINELLHLVINPGTEVAVMEIIPYSLLIFITIWAAKVVEPKVLRWLVWLSVFEVGVAVFQRILGINSFFSSTYVDMVEDGLFYNLKVNGLHVNSSGLAYMSFLSILLFERFPQCRIMKRAPFWIICIMGIVLAFNRTMMIALVVYIMICALKSHKRRIIVPIIIALAFIVLSLPGVMELIIFQVTRGGDSLSSSNALSGREEVFPLYLNFIKNHFFFGNGSFKLFFKDGDFVLHAHNSYLQTFANNGIFIFILYMALLIQCINSQNIQYAIPILVCGFFQVFIFWGTSYNDFVFYALTVNIYSLKPAKQFYHYNIS